MAQYKVPQDVEADDKLLGPFTFRQFVYLLITAALVGILIFLFQLFPLLALIPLPFILLFGALALPIKKDQPMETYLAAIVSYYLKPRTRIWNPGQRESTIQITAPKIVEDKKTRDISGEEATHRLSFLADIVDTQGQSVNAFNNGIMRDDLVAEAKSTADMFENNQFDNINMAIAKDQQSRHEELMKKMRSAIAANEAFSKVEIKPTPRATIKTHSQETQPQPAQAQQNQAQPAPADPTQFRIPVMPAQTEPLATSEEPAPASKKEPRYGKEVLDTPVVVEPTLSPVQDAPKATEKTEIFLPEAQKSDMIKPADNADHSVATSVNEEKGKDDGEVFVSLH